VKVALYARYSTDNQRDASIADQFRVCRAHAEKQGWQIVEEYSDHAISGASLLRAGMQALIADALRGRFGLVLSEAMDRLSRDQEDIAGLYKRMAYADVKIVTLSEGEVTHLHVGLKGTMNAYFSRIWRTRPDAVSEVESNSANLAAATRMATTWSSNSPRLANQSAAIARSMRSRRRSCAESFATM
jgi:Resolvase, N terminal domain